mmetsp:Transcript_51287/g.148910  ORF Transcript_51287/g.148910 Transcript_51287/m.148910 type:complete len:254 (+) Transcript_51287:580-1341(+)
MQPEAGGVHAVAKGTGADEMVHGLRLRDVCAAGTASDHPAVELLDGKIQDLPIPAACQVEVARLVQAATTVVDEPAGAGWPHQHGREVHLATLAVRVHPCLHVVDVGPARCGGVADEDRQCGPELRQRPITFADIEARDVALGVGLDVESLEGAAIRLRYAIDHLPQRVVREPLTDLPSGREAACQQQPRRVQRTGGNHQRAACCELQLLMATSRGLDAEACGNAIGIVEDFQGLRVQLHLEVPPLQCLGQQQ